MNHQPELAPHVDPAWAESVVLELRLRGVDGAGIGAALAEVESHCAESGESAPDAFGDPVAYARALELPTPQSLDPAQTALVVAPTLLQIVGMWIVGMGVEGVRDGRLEITSGRLLGIVLVAAALAGLIARPDPVLRLAARRPVVAGLTTAAVMVAVVAAGASLRGVVAQWSGPVVLVAGLVALVAGTVWSVRAYAGLSDHVRSPLSETTLGTPELASSRDRTPSAGEVRPVELPSGGLPSGKVPSGKLPSGGAPAWAFSLAIPVATLVMAGLAWFVR